MSSLPGIPGSLGFPSSGDSANSDSSFDLPAPGRPPSGPNGFNRWAVSPFLGGFGSGASTVGIDARLKQVFTYATAGYPFGGGDPSIPELYTFDFSAGVPGSPSSVNWDQSPIDPTSTFLLGAVLPSDFLDNVWVLNRYPGQPSTLQAYSISSGSQVSSTPTPTPDSTYALLAATSFSVGGLAQLAVWYGVYNEVSFTFDSVFLQIYDVSTGSPSAVAALSFTLDEGDSAAVDGGVFYDGVGSLWVCTYSQDDSGLPTGGTLHKFSVPGYVSVASATFSGTYGFIGDSCTGHI